MLPKKRQFFSKTYLPTTRKSKYAPHFTYLPTNKKTYPGRMLVTYLMKERRSRGVPNNPSSNFYLFGQNFSNCRPLLWITFLVKTGVWWHDGNVEEHQMSIHPRMSFIDQDAVELWPFEVNGAAVGGEWELSMSPRKRITMTSPRLCASKETRDPSIVWTCRVRKPHGVT